MIFLKKNLPFFENSPSNRCFQRFNSKTFYLILVEMSPIEERQVIKKKKKGTNFSLAFELYLILVQMSSMKQVIKKKKKELIFA